MRFRGCVLVAQDSSGDVAECAERIQGEKESRRRQGSRKRRLAVPIRRAAEVKSTRFCLHVRAQTFPTSEEEAGLGVDSRS